MSWGRLEQPTLRTNYGLLPRGRRILERHSTPAKKIHECVLLHVEDDDGAAYLFQTALGQTDLRQYFHVSNGEEAMAFLLQQGAYSLAPRPDLVLLDLNLPQKSGFDVLADMKSNPHLRDITVLVFSTSTLPYDREKSMELGADEYLTKDGDFESFVNVAKSVCQRITAGRTF